MGFLLIDFNNDTMIVLILLTVLATALKNVDIYVEDEGQILNGEY